MSASIIQRFFTMSPFLIRVIPKPAEIINEVSPNLFENLRDSSRQFLKGIINKDVPFIRQVTTHHLGNRLAHQLETQFKQTNFQQLFSLNKYNIDTAQSFQISPYVIFGQEIQNRINSTSFMQGIRPFTSNRFIKMDPKLNFMQRFKSYGNKQIYGFNCLYQPLKVNVTEEQRKGTYRPFMVSFQTDSTNIDPYIVDCQGALLMDWRANPTGTPK